MPNRSISGLPAIFVDTTSDWDIARNTQKEAYSLDVFDMTYLHFHNTLELGYCVRGEGVCYVEEGEYPFRAGDVQIIFPFQRHLSSNVGLRSSLWHWINIDPIRVLMASSFTDIGQADRWLHREMGICGIVHPKEHSAIARLVRQIIFTNCQVSDGRVHRREYLCASLYLLILELCEASRGLPPLRLRNDARFESLLPALDRIKGDLEQDTRPEVSALAALCGMSSATFRRVFTRTIGLSPLGYIHSSMMRKARQMLLTSDRTILDIGLSAGFEDISGFNRRFASHVGMTPSAYRKQFKKE